MTINQIETQDELSSLTGERRLVDIWRREIENAKKYHETSKETAKQYQELYEDQESETRISLKSNFPIFWSNTQVLRPLLFSKLPKANITQAFFNEDDISRISSEVVERLIDEIKKQNELLTRKK